MKRTRWAFVAVAGAGLVGLVAPAVGQGKATHTSLGWSRSQGGATLASYDFGAVADGSTVSRWLRLGSSLSTKSAELEVFVIGSPAFSVTADRCSGKSVGKKLSCWVRVAYAPLGGTTSETARLRASGVNGATATLRLTGSNAGGPFGHVYWADYDTVNAFPTGGGTSVTLASAPDALGPVSMAVDGTHIYWANDGGPYPGSLEKVSLGGGNATILATGQNDPDSVAVDGTHVYWADYAEGTVNEVTIGGGTVTTLATGQNNPVSVAADGTHVYWADEGTYPVFNDGTVNEVPVGGGPVTTLATGQDTPYALAVDGTNVYWSNNSYGGGGTVNEVPVGGGSVITLATGQPDPAGLAVDGTHAYWTNEGDGTVNEVPIGGGTVTALATDQDFPGPLAVDGAHVYWSNHDGSVYEVPVGGGPVTTLTNCQLPDCQIQALAVGP